MEAAKCYVRLRPRTILDGLRLYTSFLASIIFRVLFSSEFGSLGSYVPGKSLLKVSLFGVVVQLRPGTNDIAIMASTTEPRTAGWFRLRTGDTLVDVGAHIGRHSLMAAKRASRVVSIEPEPSNFALLVSNIRLNNFTNVLPLRLALGERPGRIRLYLGRKGNLGTWSINPAVSVDPSWDKSGDQTEVECDTLDRVIARVGMERVDWLKIDVEGQEVQVLKGGKNTLAKARHVILEVSEGNESDCHYLVRQARLQIVSIEKAGGPTTNWLLEPL